jgi:hypothetical protein
LTQSWRDRDGKEIEAWNAFCRSKTASGYLKTLKQ